MFPFFCFVVSLASPLIVVEEQSQNTFTVTLTVQAICHEVNHTLHVCFGQRKMGSDEECDFSGGVKMVSNLEFPIPSLPMTLYSPSHLDNSTVTSIKNHFF